MSRRDVLRLTAFGTVAPAGLAGSPPGRAGTETVGTRAVGARSQVPLPVPPSWVVKPFDNHQVTLHDSLFTANRDRVGQFLLNYPIDNMLYLFRRNAGLPTLGASAPGGWEVDGGNLRGHYAGHFLSAHALGYAGTGDAAFLDRVTYLVSALGECQDALNAQVGKPGTTSPITWTPGSFGNALELDGASNYVTLPAGIVNGLSDFTIATWVRPATVTTWSRVFDFGTGTTRYMFLTLDAGGGPRFAISTGGSGAEQRISSPDGVAANAWTHLAVTLSGTTGTLYVNGSPVATNTAMTLRPSDLGSTGNNWIGRSQYGDPLLAGAVDEFQIYDRALRPDEVQGLTTSAASGGSIAWYRFDETGGATAHDSSGNARDATVFAGLATPPGPSHAGYLAAYPETQFIELESFAHYPAVWAPWYTFHMILRGLLDAYVYCGNEQALAVAAGMGDWAWSRLRALSRETLDGMWRIYIAGEYNAAPAALTDLSVLTGNEDYFNAAQCFVNTYLFDAAVANQDTLNGEHANQHIPQYLGYLYLYERFTGAQPAYREGAGGARLRQNPAPAVLPQGPAADYLSAAKNFWDMVVPHRIYVDGGMAGSGEIFGARDVIASTIQRSNAETCCEYNMLKLSRQLFFHTADPKYMQYYERALYGQILASRQNVGSDTDPLLTYFIPVNPGAVRDFGNLGTCCGGTGLESHQKFQDSIYFRAVDDSALYVNLYVPSTVHWPEKGVVVEQATQYPIDPAGTARLTITGSGHFALKLRVPYWVRAGYRVRVNGVPQRLAATPGSYVTIDRHWRSGDTVSIAMPFTLRAERALDQPQTQALAYGPVPMVSLNASTSYQSYSFYPGMGLRGDLAHVLAPGGGRMEFSVGGNTVRPFYIDDTSAYHVYFHREEPEVVFAGVDTGVPNVARADGLTFLDLLWSGAPFATQSQFRRAVRSTAADFARSGLLTGGQNRQLVTVAERVTLGP